MCSALRMWTKPTARSSSPSRRPMPPCTSRKKCIRAALRFDSDNKNLSRFPVDFTGTSGEVFLLFLSGKPMLLCQRNRSGIPLRQPPMRPWTTKLTLPSWNCCLLHYWPNCRHHRQVHARVNLFHYSFPSFFRAQEKPPGSHLAAFPYDRRIKNDLFQKC